MRALQQSEWDVPRTSTLRVRADSAQVQPPKRQRNPRCHCRRSCSCRQRYARQLSGAVPSKLTLQVRYGNEAFGGGEGGDRGEGEAAGAARLRKGELVRRPGKIVRWYRHDSTGQSISVIQHKCFRRTVDAPPPRRPDTHPARLPR